MTYSQRFFLVCSLVLIVSVKITAATLIVTNPANSGVGTLRGLVASASPGDTIIFAPELSGMSILLATNIQISINKNLTIDGSGLSKQIHINGNATCQIFGVISGVTATLQSLTITNGYTDGSGGVGGVGNAGTLVVNNCTIAKNTGVGPFSAGFGGIRNNGSLTLNNSTVVGNVGVIGTGGIYNGGTLTMNNCTVVNNVVTKGVFGSFTLTGGMAAGVYNAGTLIVKNSTIVDNIMDDGPGYTTGLAAGVFNGGTLSLTNTIVCSNTATSGFQNFGGNNYSGASNIMDTNAFLAPLGNYGGPTQTMPPLPGSPAVDAGLMTGLSTDQRGFPRSIGLAPDIGAVEGIYNSAGVGILTGTTQLANGSVQFSFTNFTDTSYTVKASTNLLMPLNSWSYLGSAVETPVGSGQFQFIDQQATNYLQRYYLVQCP